MGIGTKRTAKTLGLAGAAAAGTYLLALRPWHSRWGATDDETGTPLPGDDFVADATSSTTRAITIAAPPLAVWARIIQLGHETYDSVGATRFDEWLGLSVRRQNPHGADGQLSLGDELRLGPAVSGLPVFSVAVIDPGRTLVLSTPGWETRSSAATWTFALRRVGPGATRLIIRFQSQSRTVRERVRNRLVGEPLQFARERALLKGVRERAERAQSVPRGGRRS
ncbi:hypothetical protein ACFQJC_13830 [Haloferax namakaokahaiae]|uniref:SRPBCC family protein n=1 Tax=Haloferax namakaokahaiae TaxID=1748331 RepID=A0ABD5ZHT3_9EURY